MVVTESNSQLPHWPVLTQWRPSGATHHPVPIFSGLNEKQEWRILHSERKPACLNHPWAFNTHIFEQDHSYPKAASMENWVLGGKVHLLCGWRKRGMGKPGPLLRSHMGLSQAQDKPLILCAEPCAMYHAASPDKDQDWISHLLILHTADVYRCFYQTLQKGACLRSLFTHSWSSELSNI